MEERKPCLLTAEEEELLVQMLAVVRAARCEVCGVATPTNVTFRKHIYCQKCLEQSLLWSAQQAYLAGIEAAANERIRKENAEQEHRGGWRT